MNPLISVVISTYNRAEYLRKAVASVLAQSYKNIELIIVNNGSTDETSEVISKISSKDDRIITITNEINLKRGQSSNKGIKGARGKYIARLDDDDYWADEKKLEKQIDFLENHPEYAVVGSGMIIVDKNEKEIIRCLFPKEDEDIRGSILFDNLFAHSSVVFRKDLWEKAGGYYNGEINLPEDWDLWLKLGKIGKFYNFDEYFLYYLQAGQNTFKQNSIRNLKINNQIRRKYRKDYSGFGKAFFLGWASYFYSFLPFKKELRPILFKLGMRLMGPSSYRRLN